MTDKTGGPAFPTMGEYHKIGNVEHCDPGTDGMTLRDWFAANAPFSQKDVSALALNIGVEVTTPAIFKFTAELQYAYADCMLEARKK